MIRVEHLSKKFGDLTVLSDVNIHIKKGEVISVIGPSGTGKSTFLRCLNLLDPPSGGKIFIDGQEITAPGAKVSLLRQKMGMVFQDFNLFMHLSVLDNLILAPVKLLGKSKEEATAQARELLQMVGLLAKEKAYPSELSGGQKQRVAIARALIAQPKIILADEPTGALDTTTSLEVMQILKDVNDQGITVIIVTHEHDIAAMTRKIIRLKDGMIEETIINGELKMYRDRVRTDKTYQYV